jgi:molybdopterin-guanine dinucleotide biosynthesis protein B
VSEARVLGIVGWSGSGKTALIVKLIPLLTRRGIQVATLKHAHHAFDVDHPGKDSFMHRQAGACEVIVSSEHRWVLMHELRGAPEVTLPELLRRVSPCDLILVEGFKTHRHPKLEVFRAALGKPPLYPDDPNIVALASDGKLPGARVPVLDLNDTEAIATEILNLARPLSQVLSSLATHADGSS